jgi:hypothetical protein
MTNKQELQNAAQEPQAQGTSQFPQVVFEIAILARVKWNLHSLNNEGTIGNVTEPRTIALWDGTKTDGVSGEMMKAHPRLLDVVAGKNEEPFPLSRLPIFPASTG